MVVIGACESFGHKHECPSSSGSPILLNILWIMPHQWLTVERTNPSGNNRTIKVSRTMIHPFEFLNSPHYHLNDSFLHPVLPVFPFSSHHSASHLWAATSPKMDELPATPLSRKEFCSYYRGLPDCPHLVARSTTTPWNDPVYDWDIFDRILDPVEKHAVVPYGMALQAQCVERFSKLYRILTGTLSTFSIAVPPTSTIVTLSDQSSFSYQ